MPPASGIILPVNRCRMTLSEIRCRIPRRSSDFNRPHPDLSRIVHHAESRGSRSGVKCVGAQGGCVITTPARRLSQLKKSEFRDEQETLLTNRRHGNCSWRGFTAPARIAVCQPIRQAHWSSALHLTRCTRERYCRNDPAGCEDRLQGC